MQDGTSLVVDEAYVRESILQPQAKIREGYGTEMVPAELTDEEISAVVDFLKSQVQEATTEQAESIE